MRLQWLEYDEETGRLIAQISEPNASIDIRSCLFSVFENLVRPFVLADPMAGEMLHKLAMHIGANGGSCRVDGAGLTAAVSQPAVVLYVPPQESAA